MSILSLIFKKKLIFDFINGNGSIDSKNRFFKSSSAKTYIFGLFFNWIVNSHAYHLPPFQKALPVLRIALSAPQHVLANRRYLYNTAAYVGISDRVEYQVFAGCRVRPRVRFAGRGVASEYAKPFLVLGRFAAQ